MSRQKRKKRKTRISLIKRTENLNILLYLQNKTTKVDLTVIRQLTVTEKAFDSVTTATARGL